MTDLELLLDCINNKIKENDDQKIAIEVKDELLYSIRNTIETLIDRAKETK